MHSKTVLITGATSGFGELLTKSLLKRGHYVIATGRNILDRKSVFKEEILNYKTHLKLINLDLTKSEQRHTLVDYLKQNEGLDIVVNNAGVGHFGPLEFISDEKIDHIFETNVIGMMKLTRDVLPLLRKNKKSRIINVSSAFGFVGFPLTSLYCSSKFAVEGFSQALAYELCTHGVDVLTIRPGGFRTRFLENASKEHVDEGVYFEQMTGLQHFQRKMSSRTHPPDPMKVVNKMIKMIEGQINKSVVVGPDAQISWIFKKVLPEIVHSIFMNTFSEKLITKGKLNHG